MAQAVVSLPESHGKEVQSHGKTRSGVALSLNGKTGCDLEWRWLVLALDLLEEKLEGSLCVGW